nr:serine/threonine-protein kinase RIO2 [Andalucia godoyi]|eukprot:ANDGO_05095.mRNA.1 Serine/threonine-protein kinase rio2
MVRFDIEPLIYLEKGDWRTLVAIEMGMKNHEVVPTPLIQRIAFPNRSRNAIGPHISRAAKLRLIHHECLKYDGYKLTYAGYDYLAVHAFSSRQTVTGIGSKVGVGKESDVFAATNDMDRPLVIKFHRLGRTSFRGVKEKRDYLQHRTSASWLYLSRLAAAKEYAFMKALHSEGFPVPEPVDWSRHAVVMERVAGWPLASVRHVEDAGNVFRQCVKLLVQLAEVGLIHGDFNEFNLMIKDDDTIVFIDFPQMVSTSHPNAEELFQRDVKSLKDFFRRRFRFETEFAITLDEVEKRGNLDSKLEASGWSKDLESEFQTNNSMEDLDDDDDDDDEQEEQEEEGEVADDDAAEDGANSQMEKGVFEEGESPRDAGAALSVEDGAENGAERGDLDAADDVVEETEEADSMAGTEVRRSAYPSKHIEVIPKFVLRDSRKKGEKNSLGNDGSDDEDAVDPDAAAGDKQDGESYDFPSSTKFKSVHADNKAGMEQAEIVRRARIAAQKKLSTSRRKKR